MAMITYALIISGDIGAPLYGGYLWASIANGFRFGKKYLYITQTRQHLYRAATNGASTRC
jgi:hypothetical protein